jgi:2-methylisocitrate lyase-like PEP mutase family enzyme
MNELEGRAARFLALHRPGQPLLQPNAWDAGSARILEALGFEAIATTSSGFAATLGRTDGSATKEEVLDHCARLAAAVRIPVSADTENGFTDHPAGVAETVRQVAATGVAGCSIEDFTRRRDDPVYEPALAVERVAAAAEAAHRGPHRLVLTARAENHLHGRDDVADTISRLQAYQEAGADVLFAPGIFALEDIRAVVSSVDRPLNVLVRPGTPPVVELAQAGVARISVGGALAYAAYAQLVDSARELKEHGRYGYLEQAAAGRAVLADALAGPGAGRGQDLAGRQVTDGQ